MATPLAHQQPEAPPAEAPPAEAPPAEAPPAEAPPAEEKKKKRKRKKRKLAEGEEKKPFKPTAWNMHVAEFRKAHPELSFKEVLQQAKLTYKKEEVKK